VRLLRTWQVRSVRNLIYRAERGDAHAAVLLAKSEVRARADRQAAAERFYGVYTKHAAVATARAMGRWREVALLARAEVHCNVMAGESHIQAQRLVAADRIINAVWSNQMHQLRESFREWSFLTSSRSSSTYHSCVPGKIKAALLAALRVGIEASPSLLYRGFTDIIVTVAPAVVIHCCRHHRRHNHYCRCHYCHRRRCSFAIRRRNSWNVGVLSSSLSLLLSSSSSLLSPSSPLSSRESPSRDNTMSSWLITRALWRASLVMRHEMCVMMSMMNTLPTTDYCPVGIPTRLIIVVIVIVIVSSPSLSQSGVTRCRQAMEKDHDQVALDAALAGSRAGREAERVLEAMDAAVRKLLSDAAEGFDISIFRHELVATLGHQENFRGV